MKKKMLKFVELKQETPEKRDTVKRKGDFNEIYNADKPKKKTTRRSRRGKAKAVAAAVTPEATQEEE